MFILELLAVALLTLAVDYVLALLLRVSCHFCTVEIPTLGRAMFSVALTVGLGLLAAFAIQTVATGFLGANLLAQFLTFVAALATHAVITTILYAPLLGIRLGKAFSVWLVQALVFAGFGLVMGCCFAMLRTI